MSKQILSIHDDLLDENRKIITSKYCCPIYIADQFGIALSRDTDLVSLDGNVPTIRNGTLTFVKYQGQLYGLTCRHVIDELERQSKLKFEKWSAYVDMKNLSHPMAQLHLFCPKGKAQVHINSHFHKTSGDEYTQTFSDIAVAKLDNKLANKLGREAIDISDDPPSDIFTQIHICGIATGYPELKRTIVQNDEKLTTLRVSVVTTVSEFETIDDSKIRLYSELDHEPDANNLSGMSGGPIIWSNNNGWGFAGIIKEGRDIKPKTSDTNPPIVDKHVIWINGERITKKILY